MKILENIEPDIVFVCCATQQIVFVFCATCLIGVCVLPPCRCTFGLSVPMHIDSGHILQLNHTYLCNDIPEDALPSHSVCFSLLLFSEVMGMSACVELAAVIDTVFLHVFAAVEHIPSNRLGCSCHKEVSE